MDANIEKYGTFLNERVLESKHCYVLFLIHTTELLLLSCFHLCKSITLSILPPFIEVISTNCTFFLSKFLPQKDLLSVRNLLLSGFPQKCPSFCPKY